MGSGLPVFRGPALLQAMLLEVRAAIPLRRIYVEQFLEDYKHGVTSRYFNPHTELFLFILVKRYLLFIRHPTYPTRGGLACMHKRRAAPQFSPLPVYREDG